MARKSFFGGFEYYLPRGKNLEWRSNHIWGINEHHGYLFAITGGSSPNIFKYGKVNDEVELNSMSLECIGWDSGVWGSNQLGLWKGWWINRINHKVIDHAWYWPQQVHKTGVAWDHLVW